MTLSMLHLWSDEEALRRIIVTLVPLPFFGPALFFPFFIMHSPLFYLTLPHPHTGTSLVSLSPTLLRHKHMQLSGIWAPWGSCIPFGDGYSCCMSKFFYSSQEERAVVQISSVAELCNSWRRQMCCAHEGEQWLSSATLPLMYRIKDPVSKPRVYDCIFQKVSVLDHALS